MAGGDVNLIELDQRLKDCVDFAWNCRYTITSWWTKLRFMRCGRRDSRSWRNPISTGYFFARASFVNGFCGV